MPQQSLSQILDTAAFYSLSVVAVGQQWQANLQIERGNSFRVEFGSTPSEAIAALFDLPATLPPCPIPLPPCPVNL